MSANQGVTIALSAVSLTLLFLLASCAAKQNCNEAHCKLLRKDVASKFQLIRTFKKKKMWGWFTCDWTDRELQLRSITSTKWVSSVITDFSKWFAHKSEITFNVRNSGNSKGLTIVAIKGRLYMNKMSNLTKWNHLMNHENNRRWIEDYALWII